MDTQQSKSTLKRSHEESMDSSAPSTALTESFHSLSICPTCQQALPHEQHFPNYCPQVLIFNDVEYYDGIPCYPEHCPTSTPEGPTRKYIKLSNGAVRPPMLQDENDRLSSVRSYPQLSPSDPNLLDLTQLAASICKAPISTITMVDDKVLFSSFYIYHTNSDIRILVYHTIRTSNSSSSYTVISFLCTYVLLYDIYMLYRMYFSRQQ